MWEAQISTLLYKYDLMGYIGGSYLCLDKTLIAKDKLWNRQDSPKKSAIMASGDVTIALVVGWLVARACTTKQAWDNLNTMYANKSQSRVYGLRNTLVKLMKDNMLVVDYLR